MFQCEHVYIDKYFNVIKLTANCFKCKIILICCILKKKSIKGINIVYKSCVKYKKTHISCQFCFQNFFVKNTYKFCCEKKFARNCYQFYCKICCKKHFSQQIL